MLTFNSENELNKYLMQNFKEYFNCEFIARELSVGNGKIDLVGKDFEDNIYLIEIKSQEINNTAVKQLQEYMEKFYQSNFYKSSQCRQVIGILAAPKINKNIELPKNFYIKKLDDIKVKCKKDGCRNLMIKIEDEYLEEIKKRANQQGVTMALFVLSKTLDMPIEEEKKALAEQVIKSKTGERYRYKRVSFKKVLKKGKN